MNENNKMGEFNEAEEKLNKETEIAEKADIEKRSKEPAFQELKYPKVYAFKVDEINEANNLYAVKVGDTARLVDERLEEWRKNYPNLYQITEINAFIDFEFDNKPTERKYFRDHKVHKWLEEKGYIPLVHSKKPITVESLKNSCIKIPADIEKISQEFYVYNGDDNSVLNEQNNNDKTKVISKELLNEFIEYAEEHPDELKDNFSNHKNENYSMRYKEAETYAPFPYQEQAVKDLVDKFFKKVEINPLNTADNKVLLNSGTGSGKSNMLMWAAKAIYESEKNSELSEDELYNKVFSKVEHNDNTNKRTFTIATTAIPDVLDEIRKTIETHEDFRDDYYYFSSKEVKITNGQCIKDAYEGKLKDREGKTLPPCNNIVVGISLQDVSGREEDGQLKPIHKILEDYPIDLVIGDEAHFAMFSGDVYKKSLKDEDGDVINELNSADKKEYNKFRKLFTFNPRLGYLFASATVENLLLENIFNLNDDVVYISQDTIDNQAKEENDRFIKQDKETNSPFFGKPTMNYFALDLGDDVSALFSVNEDGKFLNKQAESIFSILLTDRKEESDIKLENVIPRLISSETFQKAGAGRHILISVSRKNQADALEKFLNDIKDEIVKSGNGKDVHILNVSSTKDDAKFTKMITRDIKKYLENNRFDNTITITADRLNVGVSIDQWDTVVLARGGNNLNKRQQIYGRVSRTWNETVELEGEDGEKETYKFNLKPNSFIIDFQGDRVYEIENEREINHDVLNGGRGNNSFKKIITVEEGNLRQLEKQDVHKQLKAVLKRYTVSQHKSKIPSYNFDFSEDFLSTVQIKKAGKRTTVNLDPFVKKDEGLDIFVPVGSGTNEAEDSKPKNAKDEDTIPSDNDTIDKKELRKKENELTKKKKALEEMINEKLLISGVILNYIGFDVDSFNKLYKFLYKPVSLFDEFSKNVSKDYLATFDVETFKNNIGLTPELSPIIKEVKNSKRLNAEFTKALKALNTLAIEDNLGFVKVLNGLSRVSNNEVLTPIEPINVAKLIVDNINFKELNTNDRNFDVDPITVINNGDKTGILEIEAFNKIAEDLGTDIAEKTKFYSIPTSNLTYEFIKALYVKLGWDTDWIIWDNNNFQNGILDCFKDNWAYAITLTILYLAETDEKEKERLQKNLDKITGKDKDIDSNIVSLALINFVKDRFMKDGELRKFDVVVSNPPYQVDTGGKRHQVYADFYIAGSKISNQLSMVFPKGWQTSTGRASGSSLHSTIREDRSIVSVDNYNEDKDSPIILFKDAGTSGVNILYRNNNKDSGTVKLYEYGELIDDNKDLTVIEYWNDTTDKIFDKMTSWMESVGVSSTREIVSGRNPFGVDNAIWTDNTRPEGKYITEDKNNSYNFYGQAKKGKSPTRKLISTNSPSLKNNKVKEHNNKFKIVWTTFAGPAVYRKAIILNEDEFCTNQFLGILKFNSKREAKNFMTYFSTLFYRFLLSERMPTYNPYRSYHEFVPDLSTITNPRTGKVGWDSDWTDDDLKILFKNVLTDEDWEYIEKTAIKSDPAGLKIKKQ